MLVTCTNEKKVWWVKDMKLEEEGYGELGKIEDDKGEWLRGCS